MFKILYSTLQRLRGFYKHIKQFITSKFHLCFISGLSVAKHCMEFGCAQKSPINKWNFVVSKTTICDSQSIMPPIYDWWFLT